MSTFHPEEQASTPRILVVDDQTVMRKLLCGGLSTAGFTVEAVADGKEALAYCAQTLPDLILLDAMMPELDGFATCAELRTRPECRYLPILMMTLLDDSSSVGRAFEAGVTDFIVKPINMALLVHHLRYLLKSAATVQELIASQERLDNAQSIAGLGDWEWRPGEDRLTWSTRAGEILRQPCGPVANLDTFLALFQPEGALSIRRGVLQLQTRGTELSAECCLGEAEPPTFLRVQARWDRKHQGALVLGTIQDVTEHLRLREESARATRLAALGELSAGIGHEINNPTGVILLDLPIVKRAFADMVPLLEEHYRMHGAFPFAGRPYPEMKDEIPAILDELLENAQRIKRIVEELKDFSQPVEEDGHFPVDLNLVVSKALVLVRPQLKRTTDHFHAEYAANRTLVFGDFQKLEQVVINLLLNACQSLGDRSRPISIVITPGKDDHRLVVKDGGTGIPPHLLPRLTDPFFTTRRNEGGTGLGLSISARIIEQHGGTLQIDSTPGEGTRVTVLLPVCREKVDL